jgi:hypothetical protein
MLKIRCCNKVYSISDPETFLYLKLFKHYATKRKVNNKKVFVEYTLLLNCIMNNCKVVNVIRFGHSEQQPLEIKRLSGSAASDHLIKIQNNFKVIKLKFPDYKIPKGTNKPGFYYGDYSSGSLSVKTLDGYYPSIKKV